MSEELLQLVDEEGRPTGAAPRGLCHGDPALIQAVVHLYLFDSRGRLYLQRRSETKDTCPGLWDTSVGGHVSAGEEVADALVREAREELSIDARGAKFLFGYLFASPVETEYAHVFALTWQGPIVPDEEEIEEGRFFSISEIEGLRGRGILTPMFEQEFPMLLARLKASS